MSHLLAILGHPSPQSFNGDLHRAYVEGAHSTGVQTQTLLLHELDFDPILRRRGQPLEPALLRAQQLIDGAGHVAFVTPLWWGNVPALLKGFVDRTLVTGWAYRYEVGKTFQEPLLRGRSGRLILTMDAPTWWYRLANGASVNGSLVKATMQFCGIRPVKSTLIGKVRELDQTARERWLDRVRELGKKDALRARDASPLPAPPTTLNGTPPIATSSQSAHAQ